MTASDNWPHVRGADVKLAAHYCQSGGTAAKCRGRKTQHDARPFSRSWSLFSSWVVQRQPPAATCVKISWSGKGFFILFSFLIIINNFWIFWNRYCHNFFAFSALTLLVGRQEELPACKNWVMRCWCGYLSGARCRLFAYGPTDATAIPKPHHLLPHLNPDWSYLSGTGLPRLSLKRGHWTGSSSSSSSSTLS